MPEISQIATMLINVHIDVHHKGGLHYLNWFYNDMAGRELQLRVSRRYQQVKFQLDAETAAKFTLVGKHVEQYSDGENDYLDLVFLGGATGGDHVIVNDTHLHSDVAVGSVTLEAQPKDGVFSGRIARKTLFSDPEVLNTGNQ